MASRIRWRTPRCGHCRRRYLSDLDVHLCQTCRVLACSSCMARVAPDELAGCRLCERKAGPSAADGRPLFA